MATDTRDARLLDVFFELRVKTILERLNVDIENAGRSNPRVVNYYGEYLTTIKRSLYDNARLCIQMEFPFDQNVMIHSNDRSCSSVDARLRNHLTQSNSSCVMLQTVTRLENDSI